MMADANFDKAHADNVQALKTTGSLLSFFDMAWKIGLGLLILWAIVNWFS